MAANTPLHQQSWAKRIFTDERRDRIAQALSTFNDVISTPEARIALSTVLGTVGHVMSKRAEANGKETAAKLWGLWSKTHLASIPFNIGRVVQRETDATNSIHRTVGVGPKIMGGPGTQARPTEALDRLFS